MPKIAPHQKSLLISIALVLVVHGLLLHGVPIVLHSEWSAPRRPETPPPVNATFTTRTVEPEPQPAPRPVQNPPAATEQPTKTPHRNAPNEDIPFPPDEPPLLHESEKPSSNTLPNTSPNSNETNEKTATPPVESAPSATEKVALPAAWQYRPPLSVVLDYEVDSLIDGTERTGASELAWTQDGSNYNLRLSVSYFRITLRTQTSVGKIGAKGLEPYRFGDKTRSEVAAHFERDKGKVSFSANTPDVPIQDNTQDQLSVILQLGALLGGNPDRIQEGAVLPFQAVGGRSAENWTFIVGKMERLQLPGGEIMARHLWREAHAQYDVNVDLWFAPDLGYLPARIRLTQTNGNFVDQRWRSTEKP